MVALEVLIKVSITHITIVISFLRLVQFTKVQSMQAQGKTVILDNSTITVTTVTTTIIII